MNKSIQLCALGLIAGFFTPWLATNKGSLSGFDFVRFSLRGADGWMPAVWISLVPVLGLLVALLASKKGLGRPLAILAGLYPWGWVAYYYASAARSGLGAYGVSEITLPFLGMGAFITLGSAAALLFLGIFVRPESEK
jgi:hypothetical protein